MDKKNTRAVVGGALAGFAAGRVVDVALVGGGVAAAASAVAFAGYMTLTNAHVPNVNGMQYLAIFAQPSHVARDESKLDMTPTGSIAHAKDVVEGYALVGAQEQFAWLREGNRIFAVRPGDDVPRLGRVSTISRRDGRWALVDGNGGTMIAGGLVEAAPDATSGRFDKRMIFGNGK